MVVIAQDAQGSEVARPWVERAGGTYRALLDQHNEVGKAYNLKYVPVGILLDEEGRLVRAVGRVDIDREEFLRQLNAWVGSGAIPQDWTEADRRDAPHALTPEEAEADARFQRAIALLERGKRQEAMAELKEAFKLDPENWLIRKQLWAIETPEAFYDGEVDYDWQKEQMSKEEAVLGKQ